MGRAPCCDKAAVKRGPWSAEEDARLRSYIEQHGTGGNWIALPRKIGLKRCGKSCRLRWLNYLRPDIRHGGFSEEEDRIICSLYIAIGSRWSIIATQLLGRTDNDIKNYWNTRLKKKLFGNNNKSHAHDFIKQQQQHDQHATIHATLMPPLPVNNVQSYSSGTTGIEMHVGECVCFGGDLDMSTASTSAVGFAAGSSATMVEPTSYACTTATTELDEIFRFIGTSGGENVYSSPETSMNWHGPQLQDVQQQQQQKY